MAGVGALFYFNSDTWLQSLSSSLLQLDARLTLAQQEAINPIVTLLIDPIILLPMYAALDPHAFE